MFQEHLEELADEAHLFLQAQLLSKTLLPCQVVLVVERDPKEAVVQRSSVRVKLVWEITQACFHLTCIFFCSEFPEATWFSSSSNTGIRYILRLASRLRSKH